MVNIARELLASAAKGQTEELIHLVPELATPSDRLPFNKICRGPQKIAWGEIPMADIKAIRQNCWRHRERCRAHRGDVDGPPLR